VWHSVVAQRIPKKSLQDYVYYIGSAKQASDFTTTTEYIINYIRRTFTQGNDIANALKTREEVNMTDFMLFSSNQLNKILQKQQSKINSMRYCIEQRFRSMWRDQPFMRPTKIRFSLCCLLSETRHCRTRLCHVQMKLTLKEIPSNCLMPLKSMP
jgi:hypothetical protein